MYKIEENIEIPSSRAKIKCTIPFRDMKVGDSIFFDNMRRSRFGSVLGHIKKTLGYVYITRREADGIRIWRIE